MIFFSLSLIQVITSAIKSTVTFKILPLFLCSFISALLTPINVIDTLELARSKFPGSPSSLDALCKRFRIDNSKRVQHTALIDCDLLSKVYINLIDQREPTLEFKNDLKFEDNNSSAKISYFKKVVFPSNEEALKHKEYLKNFLKKNYF